MHTKSRKKSKQPAAEKTKSAVSADFPVRRLLVPIDFSEHSKNALLYAISLAKPFNSEVFLVYVVEPTIYPADFSFGQVSIPNLEGELRERGREELTQLVQNHIGKTLTAHTMVRTGKPYQEIIEAAEEENVDLIIIATHGHTGVDHLLFGGTAEKVVRKAPCPVLVLRAKKEHEDRVE